MVSELNEWTQNRNKSLNAKLTYWSKDPLGLIIRTLQFIYFGNSLFAILQDRGVEHIAHLAGVKKHLAPGGSTQFHPLTDGPGFMEPQYLHAVRVDLSEGLIALDSGHILVQREGSHKFLSGESYRKIRGLLRSNPITLPGVYLILPHQKYFYHFIIDELPLIIRLLNDEAELSLITTPNQPEYVKYFLEKLQEKVIIAPKNRIRLEVLRNPSRTKSLGLEEVKKVVNFVEDSSTKSDLPKRVLLLRNEVARGNSQLQTEILKVLAVFGFSGVDPAGLSIDSQAALFRNATHIVGFAGGSFTNLIFAKPKTIVLEIFNTEYKDFCFERLSQLCELDYKRIDCVEAADVRALSNWCKELFGEGH
jgi:capsular polysaccharide biosynthesis protein